jgi:DMSO/TMAO reductase YedYZ molybdopterin-dependent catalytic subunit
MTKQFCWQALGKCLMARRMLGVTTATRCLLTAGVLTLALVAPRAAESGQSQGIALIGGSGAASTLSMQMITALPAASLNVTFLTGKGPVHARFAGPLLWTILVKAGGIDPSKPRRQAGQTVLVTGQDGYSAALAIGEMSPDFEGKSVILAETMNGHPLGATHLRIVIPGDRRGARYVRDIVRIAVSPPAADPR